MAELYARQGHPEKAKDIYRKILQREPHNQPAAQALAQLEGRAPPLPASASPSESPTAQPQQGAFSVFKETLQRVIDSVPGTIAATVMGFDGIAIETVYGADKREDVGDLITEYTSSTSALHTLNTAAGPMTQYGIDTENMSFLFRNLTPDYFLAVVLKPQSLTAKARFLMRVSAPALTKELS